MEQVIQNTVMATLRVAAQPSSQVGWYNVYFLAFKKQDGMVKVQLTDRELESLNDNEKRALCEIKALEYLLAGKEILSDGRKGNSIQLFATSKLIREAITLHKLSKPMRMNLIDEARVQKLKYIKGTNLPLKTFFMMEKCMPSLISRFITATLEITADIKWINPVVPNEKIYTLSNNEKFKQSIEVNKIGRVMVTTHAFERYVQRAKFNDPQMAWDGFCKALRSPTLCEYILPSDLVDEHIKKYGTLAKHYHDPESRWHFIIIPEDGELVLVTSFLPELNNNDYSQRNR